MGFCDIDGCDLLARSRGWCLKHYTRWIRHGDPLMVRRQNWLGDDASYRAVHKRLDRERGSASSHICACGAPAQEWSFDESSGDLAYSTDLSRYTPRCRSCHAKSDGRVSKIEGKRWARAG